MEYRVNNHIRCQWAGTDPAMIQYHDTEWGKPVHDDRILFEFLILEGAQAGLTWRTILNKRAGYRKLFAEFDAARVARFTQKKIEAILENDAIVRNRLKVESTVSNAKAFLTIQKQFGSFDSYCWAFVGGSPIVHRFQSVKELPTSTPESDALSKDLKKRGFRFVGTTIMYAYMQAVGMVNDHTVDCFRHGK